MLVSYFNKQITFNFFEHGQAWSLQKQKTQLMLKIKQICQNKNMKYVNK